MAKQSAIVRIEAHPGMGDDLVAAVSNMIEAVRAEEGTLVYAFHRSRQEPDVFWFYELYTDEAAVGAHRGSDAMAAFQVNIGHLIAPGTQFHLVDLVEAKGLAFGDD